MAEDKRSGNGGHSTKSNKSTDKRRSKGKEMLNKYIEEDVDYSEYKKMMDEQLKLAVKGDTKAATFWSDRVIGKPKETKDITSNGDTINIPISVWADDKESE